MARKLRQFLLLIIASSIPFMLESITAGDVWGDQRFTPAQIGLRTCGGDIARLCSHVIPGGGRIIQCISNKRDQLSPNCRDLVDAFVTGKTHQKTHKKTLRKTPHRTIQRKTGPDRNAVLSPNGGTYTEEIGLSGYKERPYDLFVPDNVKAPAPVLLVLHGGGGDVKSARKVTCPLGNERRPECIVNHAARNGYIVVLPRGTAAPQESARRIRRSWNAGGGDPAGKWICTSRPACEDDVDDIAYFNALLDDLKGRAPVDMARVYATGISTGGAMSHLLACKLPDRIAAIASVGGTFQVIAYPGCDAPGPVPILQIHGTRDCVWPYKGGLPTCGRFEEDKGASFLGVNRSNAYWAQKNGCAKAPKKTVLPDRFKDGTTVIRYDGQNCIAPLVLYRVEGGGHVWPSGAQYLPARTFGHVTKEIGMDEIWAFLSVHSLPEGYARIDRPKR